VQLKQRVLGRTNFDKHNFEKDFVDVDDNETDAKSASTSAPQVTDL